MIDAITDRRIDFKIGPRLLAGVLASFLFAPLGQGAEMDAPPPLGKLYEVGGHKMHLYHTGNTNSGPTVVLEAGSGAFSLDWYLVQQQVAKFAPVCSYDRAGHAWSELGPTPRTMKQAAFDLHRLLNKANLHGPYLMVGHSLGGFLVRVFAMEYPNDVAGMVLLDSSIENNELFINGKIVRLWDEVQPRQIPRPRDEILDSERVLSTPELDGYKKFLEWAGPPKIEEPFDKLPEPIQKLRLWAMSLPQSNVTDYNPYSAEETFLLFADRIRMERPLGGKPLIALSRKSEDTDHFEREQKLKDLSSNSVFMESHLPVHEIQLAEPDLVVKAIQAALDSIKSGDKLRLSPD